MLTVRKQQDLIHANKIKMYKLLIFAALFTFCKCASAQFVEGAPVNMTITPKVGVPGKPVNIKGNTAVGKEEVTITIKIMKPDGKEEVRHQATVNKGNFDLNISNTKATGRYFVTGISADEKTTTVDSFFITTPSGLTTDYQNVLFKVAFLSQKATDLALERLSALPVTPELTQRITVMQDLKTKVTETKPTAEEANKSLSKYIEIVASVPEAYKKAQPYLKQLDEQTTEMRDKLPKMEEKINSFQKVPTTCENINNVVELLGFISFIMDFERNIAKTALKLTTDKVIPGILDRYSADMKAKGDLIEGGKFGIAEPLKTAAALKFSKLSETGDFVKKGLTGDVMQFVGKVLYKQMCDEITGKTKLRFGADFYDGGDIYYNYAVELTGTLKLRFPKNTDLSKPTEVTGEFEGYKTKNEADEQFENAESVPAGMTIINRKILTPLAINASALSEDLGLGGRSLMPGSYRVKVIGQISKDNILIKPVKSPFDMLETEEANKIMIVLIQGLMPIPLVYYFRGPIAKSKVMFIVAMGDAGGTFKITRANGKVTINDAVTNERKPDPEIKLAAKLVIKP